MADWLAILEANPNEDSKIAKELFGLATRDEAPDPSAVGEMWGFWDDIDLAKEGHYGLLQDERDKLKNFLRKWSGAKP